MTRFTKKEQRILDGEAAKKVAHVGKYFPEDDDLSLFKTKFLKALKSDKEFSREISNILTGHIKIRLETWWENE